MVSLGRQVQRELVGEYEETLVAQRGGDLALLGSSQTAFQRNRHLNQNLKDNYEFTSYQVSEDWNFVHVSILMASPKATSKVITA